MLMNKLANQGLMGSALVGGRRKKPSAWQKKVGAYARKHGISAAKAAHHLKGGDEEDYEDLFGEGRKYRRRKRRTTKGGAKSRLGLTDEDIDDLLYEPLENAQSKLKEKQWLKAAKLFRECEVPKKNASKAELKRYYEAGELKLVLDLAKLILDTDPFNDTALKYQLKGLRKLKGIDYSKRVYDQFVMEYKKSFGTDYAVSFEKIIQ